jgi:ABC-type glycerol-3-phosphate transport system substrate-binding protein
MQTNSNNPSPVVVYVNWEGRGYSKTDWKADLAVIASNLPGPCFWTFYDVGLLVSETSTPDFTNVVSTRYGQSSKEDWTQPVTLDDGSAYVQAFSTLKEVNGNWTAANSPTDLEVQLTELEALEYCES